MLKDGIGVPYSNWLILYYTLLGSSQSSPPCFVFAIQLYRENMSKSNGL